MENSNFTSVASNDDSENASFVTMTAGMLPVALYSTEISFVSCFNIYIVYIKLIKFVCVCDSLRLL